MSTQTGHVPQGQRRTGPLAGLRVLDVATLFAGPLAATLMADFGADVIKIEHPRGDSIRSHAPSKDGIPLWWKVIGRNKRAITLNLSKTEGQNLFLRLVRKADVAIENFRPGTLERWGLGYEQLSEVNPELILLRVTGFGQFGPYSNRPGFGTIAEAMSGFASITGQQDGPPTLPPFGLADGITGLAGTAAIMFALRAREKTGKGQVIDIALIEPILTVLGAQVIAYDQLGIVQRRVGNRSVKNAPRNTYKTADGKWVAISASAQSVAERVMKLIGWPEAIDEPWFRTAEERAKHADEIDARVGEWIGKRELTDVVSSFEQAQAAIAPIYDIEDILQDPQYRALNSIVTIDDHDLGELRMQNVMFRLSETPGEVCWAGKNLGEDNQEVFGSELGLSDDALRRLHLDGVI